ncbi:MAG: ABC transporter substrate-binding protein, partial [Serratia marcescens]|nr:ABC transporter substrate-binding protein [Serratia marcescens]
KFHSTDYFKPTREFNADDVLFTFQRMLDKNHPFRKAYPTEFPYFTDMGLDKNIARVEKLDEHTVKFTLNEVDAAFIQNLAMPFPSIQSAEYAAQLLKQGKASDINQKPIGTGPFVFSRYQKDAQIRFKGNKDYWKPEDVKIDNLIFSINTDAAVRAQKLKAGECQITLNPRPADLKALQEAANLKVPSQPGFNLGYIAYNVTHKPFDQLEVRQALDMAVNKQAIIDAVYQGAGQLAVNGMPPTQWSYDETIKDAPFDPAKARELLKKAGVTEGTEITLWAMPVQRPYNPNAKLMAEMIQADWAKIGVRAKIVTFEWGEYLQRIKNGEHQTALMGWTTANGDPDNFFGPLFTCASLGGSNSAKWCYKPFDQLILQAREENDHAKRVAMYQQAQVMMHDQMPALMIAHSTIFEPVRKEVKGYEIDPFGKHIFKQVSLEK